MSSHKLIWPTPPVRATVDPVVDPSDLLVELARGGVRLNREALAKRTHLALLSLSGTPSREAVSAQYREEVTDPCTGVPSNHRISSHPMIIAVLEVVREANDRLS